MYLSFFIHTDTVIWKAHTHIIWLLLFNDQEVSRERTAVVNVVVYQYQGCSYQRTAWRLLDCSVRLGSTPKVTRQGNREYKTAQITRLTRKGGRWKIKECI